MTRRLGVRRRARLAALGWFLAAATAPAPLHAQSDSAAPEGGSETDGSGAAAAAETPDEVEPVRAAEEAAGPTAPTPAGPSAPAAAAYDTYADDENDAAVLAEGRSWYAREYEAGRGVPAWAGATGVEVPIGLELGVRIVAGGLLGDPAGFLYFDPYALVGPGWGARLHVGYAVTWFSVRVEGGWMRHEHLGTEGAVVQGDRAATEVPLALVLRATLPDPTVGPYLEVGAGASAWSLPVRADPRLGAQAVELAWVPTARAAVGMRILGYLDVFAEGVLSGQDDLGGTGQLFLGPAWFVGGGVGAHFSGITR